MLGRGGTVVLTAFILLGCDQRHTAAEKKRPDEVIDKGLSPVDLAKSQVSLFVTAVDRYQQSLGEYPTTKQGLQALRSRPSDLPNPEKWNGPFFNPEITLHPLNLELPLDPWGHAYLYRAPGIHNPNGIDVWSAGPDGIDGTPDDIGNWK